MCHVITYSTYIHTQNSLLMCCMISTYIHTRTTGHPVTLSQNRLLMCPMTTHNTYIWAHRTGHPVTLSQNRLLMCPMTTHNTYIWAHRTGHPVTLSQNRLLMCHVITYSTYNQTYQTADVLCDHIHHLHTGTHNGSPSDSLTELTTAVPGKHKQHSHPHPHPQRTGHPLKHSYCQLLVCWVIPIQSLYMLNLNTTQNTS